MEEKMVKKCPNCQTEVNEEDNFCPKCGLNLKESVIDEEKTIQEEEREKKKKRKIMKKLAEMTFNELLDRGVPPEKINVIREDLRKEFLDGNLDEIPILLKDCVFQHFLNSEKIIVCTLSKEKVRCVKGICPLYKSWNLGRER